MQTEVLDLFLNWSGIGGRPCASLTAVRQQGRPVSVGGFCTAAAVTDSFARF